MADKGTVFIDGGYFAKVREQLGVYDVPIGKFSDVLCNENKLERSWTFYYDCAPYLGNPPSEEEKRKKAKFDAYVYSLERFPRLRVRLGKLSRFDSKCEGCGRTERRYKQKRVDNLLTVDLTRAVWKDRIYKAILITGDSDFVPAVDEANNAQVLTHVYYLNSSNTRIHDELYMACSERTEITKALLEKAKL